MTAHPRNFANPVDPVKLDRLAEVAVKADAAGYKIFEARK